MFRIHDWSLKGRYNLVINLCRVVAKRLRAPNSSSVVFWSAECGFESQPVSLSKTLNHDASSGGWCNACKRTQCTHLERRDSPRCSWFGLQHITPQHLVKPLDGAIRKSSSTYLARKTLSPLYDKKRYVWYEPITTTVIMKINGNEKNLWFEACSSVW